MIFDYTAFDTGGTESVGTIDAIDQHDATEKLQRKGLFVTVIAESSGGSARSVPPEHLCATPPPGPSPGAGFH